MTSERVDDLRCRGSNLECVTISDYRQNTPVNPTRTKMLRQLDLPHL